MISGKTVKAPFQRGSALIAVIAAIAIFSVLAAALLSMTSTSARQTAQAHLKDQAYFLAESAYRYVTSQYLHPPAATPDPYDVLENLDGASASLDGNDGAFDLKIFSYFLQTTSPVGVGQTALTVRAPGSLPSGVNDDIDVNHIDGQKIFIQNLPDEAGRYYEIGSLSSDASVLTIKSGLIDALDSGALIYPVADPGNVPPLLSDGTQWYLRYSGNVEMFPDRNGRIRVAGSTLTYLLKDASANAFVGIMDADGADLSGLSVPSNAKIVLLPFIRVDSTGIVGGGDTETRRTTSYYGAMPAAFSEAYAETFDDPDNPDSILTTPKGTHQIGTIGTDVNQLLMVTGTDAQGLFLSQLDVGVNGLGGDDIAKSAKQAFNGFRHSSGGYLSYDTQTKVGFFDATGFHLNYIEHSDLAAGLSFRVSSEAAGDNMYGVSFLHTQGTTGIPADIIPPGLPTNEPVMVLWQQTVDATDTTDPVKETWLAYKRLKTLFYDNFDGPGINGNIWSIGVGNWVLSNQALFITGLVDYQGRISFTVVLPQCDCASYYLRFHSDASDNAVRQVKIYSGGVEIASKTLPFGPHDSLEILDIPTAYLGTAITIQFLIDNMGVGSWEIDNVQIVNESPFPIQNATLLVRLREAAAIPFNYTGAETIESGDRVIGVNAMGRVIAPPLVALTDSPQGYLLLNSLSGTWFGPDESLNVPGKGHIANVHGAPDEGHYRKANIIKVYYASASGCTASVPDPSTPLDCYTLPYERRGPYETLKWPVQEGAQWTADKDYFRLVQWDGVNEQDGTDANVGLIHALKDTHAGSIIDNSAILSHQAKLQSPDLVAPFTAPELGLHAMGNDAAGHVYFDDFGFRLFYLPDALFPSPLQQ